MQRTNLGSTVRSMVAVLAMSSAWVFFACSGGTGERRNISATVPLNRTTVAALEESFAPQFTIPNGAVFSPGIGNNPVALTLALGPDDTSTLFTLARFGSAALARGGVTFGSCTLTITSSSFPAGQGPQTGDTITFSTCDIVVRASNVEVDGGTETGIVTLMLTNATTGTSAASTPLTLLSLVSIEDNGFLLLNDANTGIDTDVTGTIPK